MKRNGAERIGFDKLRISFVPFRSVPESKNVAGLCILPFHPPLYLSHTLQNGSDGIETPMTVVPLKRGYVNIIKPR